MDSHSRNVGEQDAMCSGVSRPSDRSPRQCIIMMLRKQAGDVLVVFMDGFVDGVALLVCGQGFPVEDAVQPLAVPPRELFQYPVANGAEIFPVRFGRGVRVAADRALGFWGWASARRGMTGRCLYVTRGGVDVVFKHVDRSADDGFFCHNRIPRGLISQLGDDRLHLGFLNGWVNNLHVFLVDPIVASLSVLTRFCRLD